MKKEYQKPVLIKERFCVEEWIASCVVENPNASLTECCSYTPPNLNVNIFTSEWTSCLISEGDFGELIDSDILCLHAGMNNVFGS